VNEVFIKLVREKNNQKRKRKRDKIKIFIWLLMKEKKLSDSNQIYNYCYSYYDCCKNVVYEAVKEMREKEIITLNKRLGDCRRKLLFIN